MACSHGTQISEEACPESKCMLGIIVEQVNQKGRQLSKKKVNEQKESAPLTKTISDL